MEKSESITLLINFNDPELEPEDRDELVQRLILELREIDEVDSVGRVLDPNPPHGSKALGGFLIGLLTTEFSVENATKLLGFLSDRLGDKYVELEVEAAGKKLKIKAQSREDLEFAIKKAQDFIEG